jgi:hypothetical protein
MMGYQTGTLACQQLACCHVVDVVAPALQEAPQLPRSALVAEVNGTHPDVLAHRDVTKVVLNLSTDAVVEEQSPDAGGPYPHIEEGDRE